MARGGKRIGSGRKKSADPTITIRVPESKKDFIKKQLANDFMYSEQLLTYEIKKRIIKSLKILENSLTLKANAGGKIKIEIRNAMKLLQIN